jgi:hypothetical protein
MVAMSDALWSLAACLWIVAAVVSGIVAGNYALLGARLWLKSRSVVGPLSAEARRTLRNLLDISRQGNRLCEARVMLLYAGLSVLAVALAASQWLGLVIAAAPLVLIWWMDVRTMTAPAVLLLGTSTHSNIKRQRDVKRQLSPLRVVSLLDVDVPWDHALADEMTLDCFRTTNEDDWLPVVTRLMDIAPVIAIDTGIVTAGLLREGRHILGSTELVRKCLFLTPPDGSAPLLDRLLPSARLERRELRVARYEEAPGVIAAMIAKLIPREAMAVVTKNDLGSFRND